MTLRKMAPYLYIAPCILLMGLFVYYPIVENFRFAFYEFSAFSPDKVFVGFENFLALFQDEVFYIAIKNNIWYAVISIICQVFGGLVLAAILEDPLTRLFSGFFRTTFFLPVIISITVIALLFSFVYNPDIGILNSFLRLLGLEEWTRAWLGESETAIFAVIAVSQWQSIGYIMMLFIVAIQSIPQELYEAADIDGANKFYKFLHITVPQVKEMLFVATLITLTGAFTVFNEPYILTSGGPGNASEVLGTLLYKSAFFRDEMGYASAIATIILILSLVAAMIQMKLFKTGKED
ncbi:carbohydrate ABC transporter permease [Robertmurraya korlensis]|jgi:raffinose/stachyose/melibiose transport system permease protein|uniref:carbohydrate ABC transporter permease n=1 Tax=Robertmurraya korlensis TaxID=519977 RepID=UPI0008256109|nr:sugar ABC transporter permease [Robertmurraya korlensis]